MPKQLYKLFVFLFIAFTTRAQINIPSTAKCKLMLRDSSIQSYHSELCYIQLDEHSQEIRIFLNFATFRTDHDSIDEWLHKTEHKILRYKGHFPIESLTSSSNYAPREILSSGTLHINHAHHHCNIKFTLINVENSLHTNNSSANTDHHIKISFSIEIPPDRYRVNFKHHSIINPIHIDVTNGEINRFVSGMVNILNFEH